MSLRAGDTSHPEFVGGRRLTNPWIGSPNRYCRSSVARSTHPRSGREGVRGRDSFGYHIQAQQNCIVRIPTRWRRNSGCSSAIASTRMRPSTVPGDNRVTHENGNTIEVIVLVPSRGGLCDRIVWSTREESVKGGSTRLHGWSSVTHWGLEWEDPERRLGA